MEYNQSVGLDLTSNIEVSNFYLFISNILLSFVIKKPPKDLLIEIRVLQTCGIIMTENGPVSLDKGSTNFLRRLFINNIFIN